MAAPGAYADTLRALGRFLDQVGAAQIVMREHEDDLIVAWEGRGGVRHERQLKAGELEALRSAAKLFRGLEGRAVRFTLAELLRTLGTMLDEAGATAIVISETPDGFRMTAQARGDEIAHSETFSELVARAQVYQRERPGGPGKA